MLGEVEQILSLLIDMGVKGDDLEDHFKAISSAFDIDIETLKSKHSQILETPKRYSDVDLISSWIDDCGE